MSPAATTRPRAHVIGAGLAGLSAAVALAREGVEVEISDAAAQAGGRCRSYFDPQLGAVVDNGNHFVVSGNTAVHAYLRETGGLDRLHGPDHAHYAMVDRADGRRWAVRPNDGAIPWWVLAPSRRLPGTRAADYLALARLLRPPPGARVGDLVDVESPIWRGLVEPLLVGVMNVPAAEASAKLTAAVLRETLLRGGRAFRPRAAEPTLAAAFVDPALAWLRERGATVRLGRRLKRIDVGGDRATALAFPDGEVALAPGDRVVVALPAWVAQELLPGISAPTVHTAIVNGHFSRPGPADAPLMQGVVGGTAQWVFGFPQRIATTTSAADDIVDLDRAELARRLWADVVAAYDLAPDAPMPAWQVVKEKRATFAATPAQDALRPSAATRWANLWLAGDWTATGLPATIEGALRSGARAAHLSAAAEPV